MIVEFDATFTAPANAMNKLTEHVHVALQGDKHLLDAIMEAIRKEAITIK